MERALRQHGVLVRQTLDCKKILRGAVARRKSTSL